LTRKTGDQEDGLGQFEIDFAYADAVTTADRCMFLRMMAGQVARANGCFASFMPKPYADRTGSGAHLNMSLARLADGENLFSDSQDPRGCGITRLGYRFIAGVVRHLPAICAVVAPTVNSYKRLVKQGSMPGLTWAPIFACYGNNNRTNAVRIPMGGGRIELRPADSACNPYLATAMVLAAGLEGIAEGLEPVSRTGATCTKSEPRSSGRSAYPNCRAASARRWTRSATTRSRTRSWGGRWRHPGTTRSGTNGWNTWRMSRNGRPTVISASSERLAAAGRAARRRDGDA
jgi:glutamine synthetase